MKKKLAVYVGINLLIWIMLLFVPTVSSYIYEKINRTYDFQPLGYLYLYEGIIVILLNLSSALVFLAGKWVRLLCCACTCALTVILLIKRMNVLQTGMRAPIRSGHSTDLPRFSCKVQKKQGRLH